jgi:hypothetical protein
MGNMFWVGIVTGAIVGFIVGPMVSRAIDPLIAQAEEGEIT